MNGTEKVTQRMVGDEASKRGTWGQKAMILDFIVRVKGTMKKILRRMKCIILEGPSACCVDGLQEAKIEAGSPGSRLQQ